MGVSQIQGYLFRGRIVVFWGLYWGLPILGKLPYRGLCIVRVGV